MRRTEVAEDWRMVQLFLSPRQPAVFEVEMNLENSNVRCTCPTFKGRTTCRHTKFVSACMDNHDGFYPLMVAATAPTDGMNEAMESPEKFRDFVLKYAKVEVL